MDNEVSVIAQQLVESDISQQLLKRVEEYKKKEEEEEEDKKIIQKITGNIAKDFMTVLQDSNKTLPYGNKEIVVAYKWATFTCSKAYINRDVPLGEDQFMQHYTGDICAAVRKQLPPLQNHISKKSLWTIYMLYSRKKSQDASSCIDESKRTGIAIGVDLSDYHQHISKERQVKRRRVSDAFDDVFVDTILVDES